MNNKKFFESFKFRVFSFDKGRHTDNYSNNGLPSNYIIFLVKGSAKLVSKHGTVYLKENDFGYIPKNCPYHSYWYTNDSSELLWYSIGIEYIPLAEGGNFIMQKIYANYIAREIFNMIIGDFVVNMDNIGMLYLFLYDVYKGMKMDCNTREAEIEKAINYMQSNPNAKIREVARHCRTSEATLYNLFKKRYKKTPNEIRQKILCEKAEELLITTGLSVEEISARLGFSSSSYFRKILKKHLNTTPTAIRKNSV